MEDIRSIGIVGRYSLTQVYPEDCKKCHNAKFATVIVDGLCLDCYLQKHIEKNIIDKFVGMAAASLSPELFNNLEDILEELYSNRHIKV